MTEHVRLDDGVSFLNERLEVSKFDQVEGATWHRRRYFIWKANWDHDHCGILFRVI